MGGLSLLGLSSLDLSRLRTAQGADAASRRRNNSCVFLFLFGGPSHIDLWDMKPKAPLQIRGEFQGIATNVPGIQVSEQLPRLAQQMDKICLLRSMTHRMNVHGPACSEVFTGREYFGPPTTDQALPGDWPSLSSLAMRYGQSARQGDSAMGMPFSVVLPWYLQFPGQSKRIAGQTGARMGEQYNSFLIEGDIAQADFEIEGLKYHNGVPWGRIQDRKSLGSTLDSFTRQSAAVEQFDQLRGQAFELLESQAGDIFDLRREPTAVRDLYGRTTVGQSLLMTRRLVEAGVSLVTVNWQDETKIDGTDTCWDTHKDNFAKLKGLLCPIMDQAFPAFIGDLADRGLLETTMVVALGEFGRTPKMGEFTQSANTKKSGRDHWPHAFTALVAGGGVRGGQIYGATNSTGGYVAEKPVSPADLSATILHHLGIDPTQVYEDEFQHLRNRLSDGEVVKDLS